MLRCAELPTLTRSRFDVVHLHSGSSLRFFAHGRILHRSAVRVAGQFFAGRCCGRRLSLRPPLTRVIRWLLSSAWRTGPGHLSVRHRLAALLCGSAAALMGFDPSQCCSGETVGGGFRVNPPAVCIDFAAPGLLSSQGPVGVFGILSADQSRLVDCGSWVFRLASRTVPTRRDRPLLPWTFPLPGLSGAIRFALPNRVSARVSTPCAGHRFPAVCGPRRPPGCTAHPLMSLGLSPALQRVGETGAYSDPTAHTSVPDRLPA